ncbi:MAG: efflux transporter outer membrane subunit [Desulfobacterales bacterium]|nr:efflux transporter outer membrane subunit [Desulfobacterales bacterium]
MFLVNLTVLNGCSPFKPAIRTSLPENLPDTFSLYSEKNNPDRQWWLRLGSTELNRLIDTGMAENLSLRETWARLAQSRAVAAMAGASRFPDLTGSASAGTSRSQSGAGAATGTQAFSIGLASSYELDLWGRLQAERQAAVLNVVATREDLNTAAISLAAEIASRWIGIVSSRKQKALLKKQLGINETILELVQLRFRSAMVSALDVYQQKQLVESVRAELPLVEEKERLLLHELAVLLGKPPGAGLHIAADRFPALPALPAVGLPAGLLTARPDIRAAGRRLAAADWQIAGARANRLPSVSLTARARYGESDLDTLFDTWLLNLSASLTAPLLDGGTRKAEVDRSRAVVDQQLAAYRDTVLNAIKEVEDALVSEDKQQAHITGLQQVIATSQKALEEASARYRNGISDYLPVLSQLLSVQSLENKMVLRQESRLATRIALHRALGGAWPSELLAPDNAARTAGHTSADLTQSGAPYE